MHNGHLILKFDQRQAQLLCEFIHLFFDTEYMDDVGLSDMHFDLLMEIYDKVCRHLEMKE